MYFVVYLKILMGPFILMNMMMKIDMPWFIVTWPVTMSCQRSKLIELKVPLQGRIQDFKLGGALKKIAPSRGRCENFWGISCEKSRFYAKKSYFFQF